MAVPQPFYLSTARGRRFCVLYEPPGGSAGARAIVHVPAFAEEMNKSRRMVALQSRRLAAAGWAVVQPDLFGCGDSDGEAGDADWSQWQADVADAIGWARERTGREPALWGLRTGCLLACQVADRLEAPTNLLLWQPVLSGAQALTQFLRMKVASQLMGDKPAARVGTRELVEALTRGQTLEVAGYRIRPGLALGLQAAELAAPRLAAAVAWLEVAAASPADVSPAARSRIDAWKAAGHRVEARAVVGPSFWQTQEIAECSEIIDASLEVLATWPA